MENLLKIESSGSRLKTFSSIDEKIKGFLHLPDGWHYGEGRPPSKSTVINALTIHGRARLLCLTTNAFPGIGGEIQVTCYNGADVLGFTLEDDGTITYALEHNETEEDDVEGLTLEEAVNKLNEYCNKLEEDGNKICSSLDLSTRFTTTTTEVGSAIWHSRITPTEAAYQLFL